MQVINLYRYIREGGGTTVSTTKPDGEYTTLFRLVADEGMLLTNGTITTSCVDALDTSVWAEIVNTEKEVTTPELTAEILEKARAYDIIMGEVDK